MKNFLMMYHGVALSRGCQTTKKQIFPLCPKVENVQWLGNMTYLVDVLEHQEWLNLSLHGQRKLMSYLGKAVFLSERKVHFPKKDLKSKKPENFMFMVPCIIIYSMK